MSRLSISFKETVGFGSTALTIPSNPFDVAHGSFANGPELAEGHPERSRGISPRSLIFVDKGCKFTYNYISENPKKIGLNKMNYIKLISKLRKDKIYLFSLKDIMNLFPGQNLKTLKNNLLNWISKGYLFRLKRDLYELIEPGRELRIPDIYLANRLYSPSYVSLETALSIYDIVPDIAAAVTSVTTGPTRTFKNQYGLFIYRTCRPEAFTGYKLMLYEGFKVCIADEEKALVDFVYYRLRAGKPLDLEEERFNQKILGRLNWQRALKYAELFNKKTVKVLKSLRGA